MTYTIEKVEKSFHVLMFRCEKNLESNIAFAWREFRAGGIGSFFSMSFIQGVLFVALFLAFFLSRFGCNKYDRMMEKEGDSLI